MPALKTHINCLLCFLSLSISVSGQTNYEAEIDSITLLLNDDKRDDTLRAQDYVELSTFYFRQNIDTTISICIEGLKFIQNTRQQPDGYSDRSLEKSKSNLLMNVGFTYYYLGKLDLSIEAFYKSLEIAERLKDDKSIADIRTNIANVQIDLGETDKAEQNLKLTLDIQTRIDDQNGTGRTLNTIGYIHRVAGNDSLALHYYNQALAIRLQTENLNGAAASYNNIAFIHRSANNFNKAISFYEKALVIYIAGNDKLGMVALYTNLANCYLELGNTSLALQNGNKGYELAKNEHLEKDLMNLTEVLYKTHKIKGNSSVALLFHEEHVALKDSVTSNKHYKSLINQELQYEFAQKEKILALEKEQEIALKEMEHQNSIALSREENYRLYLTISVVSLALLIVVVFLIFIFRQLKLLRAQKKIIEKQGVELEMIALRSQMNPHFLFNSLNSIKLYVIENEKELSARYLTKFSKLVRMVLENSNKNLISLEEELQATAYYLELEQIRFRDKFEFEIINDADVLIQLPPLVLQPYVENAIWHGIMHLENGGKIIIRTKESEAGILIEIEDNGVGRSKSAELRANDEHKNSMGMEITQKRIHSLYGLFGVQPSIEISDLMANQKACGTLVSITIPFHD